jgi:hypothetical protein
MTKDKNVTNPGTFGHGVTDAATVAEEHARVKRLVEMLGPPGLDAVGLEYAQQLREAILDKQGVIPRWLTPEVLELIRKGLASPNPPLRGL